MQQSGLNDTQLLKQHIMFKQLQGQEIQRQQQLQQLGDSRQQNSLNQRSSVAKQTAGVQYSPLITGTPVNDASQMFMNFVQRNASPAQGISDRVVPSQEQGQALRSTGLISQQFDESLYGTPVANVRGTMSQHSQIQGIPHDSANLFNKLGIQAQKPIVQSKVFSNPLVGDQLNVSPDQLCLPRGPFTSKHGLQRSNIFGQVPRQGLNSTTLLSYSQPPSAQQNVSFQEPSEKQESAGYSGVQHSPSHGVWVPLDPLEEKILYNVDSDIWDASLSMRDDTGPKGFGNVFKHTEYSNAFPSTQSGSWCALMQSAVAEASSSDAGVQEEWSGLTFQNTELSSDNQPSNMLDSGKQVWADNNNCMYNAASLGSKPVSLLNESRGSSSFLGFHQPGGLFMDKQREDLHLNKSTQKASNNTSEWLDPHTKKDVPLDRNRSGQLFIQLDRAWASQINENIENDAHQQSIASCNGVNQPSSKPEGNTIEANYKRQDFDGMPWKTGGECELTYFSGSSGRSQQVCSDTENPLLSSENGELFNFTAVTNSCSSKADQYPDHQVSDINHLVHTMQNLMKSSSQITQSYSGMAGQTYEQQQNPCKPENSNGLRSQDEEHLGKLNLQASGGHLGNSDGLNSNGSTISISLEEPLANIQGDSPFQEEGPSRGSIDSVTFQTSVGSCGPKINAQASNCSQHVLELLHRVDQSKENSINPMFDSTVSNPLYQLRGSVGQFYNQSSGSQGFALRLAPPSQLLFNSNTLLSSQDLPQQTSNFNLMQGHAALGERQQTQLTPPFSFQPLRSSSDLSPRQRWNNKSNLSDHADKSSSFHAHQSSATDVASSPIFMRNQLQTQFISNAPVSYPAFQATSHQAGGYSPLNPASPQDIAQQTCTNPYGQKFPALGDMPASQHLSVTGTHQQGGFSTKPQSLWSNTPTEQHFSGMEPYKLAPSRSTVETTLMISNNLNDQDFQSDGYKSPESGACSPNSQGSDHGEEHLGKEGTHKAILAMMLTAPQMAERNISDANALIFGSLGHSRHQALARVHCGDNNSSVSSDMNLESSKHYLKTSHGFNQNYSLLHKVLLKNMESDQSKRIQDVQQLSGMTGQQATNEPNSTVQCFKNDGLNSASHNRLPTGNTKVLLSEARECVRTEASSKLVLHDEPSQGTVTSHQKDLQSPLSGRNIASDSAEDSQSNINMAPTWCNQYETFSNGQLLSMHEARNVTTQISLVNPSQSMNVTSDPVDQLKLADIGQNSRNWPSTADTLLLSEPFSANHVLPSDVISQNIATLRPKKRKIVTFEHLSWHEEVIQGSRRIRDISMAEQDWAQSTNRLAEMVEDGTGMIEDGQSSLRSKRRLILTSQHIQQVLCSPPSSFLSANAVLYHDSVAYFAAKLSLGDACSLTYNRRNDLCAPLDNPNMILEKLKDTEGIDHHYFSKAVEKFMNRLKNIENVLLRFDKATSILDVGLECDELQKVCIINRFAKFHVRPVESGTTSSGTATGALRRCPHRYVSAQPMPRHLPEGAQCLAL